MPIDEDEKQGVQRLVYDQNSLNLTPLQAYELGAKQERERIYRVIAGWHGHWLDHATPSDILKAIQPE
jgi:hypothetical protein